MATDSEVKQVLVEARAKIADPSNWTKGAAFRGDSGNVVDFPELACKFCGIGAIWAVSSPCNRFGSAGYVAEVYLNDAAEAQGYAHVPAMNDNASVTHAQILGIYDAAIARCGG